MALKATGNVTARNHSLAWSAKNVPFRIYMGKDATKVRFFYRLFVYSFIHFTDFACKILPKASLDILYEKENEELRIPLVSYGCKTNFHALLLLRYILDYT